MPYLDDLQAIVGRLSGLGGFEDYAEKAGELCTQTMLRYIVLEQPYGHIEEFYGDTVSNRLRHTPIADGWRPETERFWDAGSAGAVVRLKNVSEHIRWVIEGTQKHDYLIPYGGDGPRKLLFWWGEPHRWPAKDGEEAGLRIFKRITHPGIVQGNKFVERAADAARPEMSEAVKTQVSNYIRDFMISNGLKEVKAK